MPLVRDVGTKFVSVRDVVSLRARRSRGDEAKLIAPLEKILYARENVDFGVLIPDDRSLRDLRDAIVWCVRSFPANFPVFRSLRLVRERRRLHTFTAGRPCVCPSFREEEFVIAVVVIFEALETFEKVPFQRSLWYEGETSIFAVAAKRNPRFHFAT